MKLFVDNAGIQTNLFVFSLNLKGNTMGQPKRKQSKQCTRLRRAANKYKLPQVVKDQTDGSFFMLHRVNPSNGMYRGRQVISVKV